MLPCSFLPGKGEGLPAPTYAQQNLHMRIILFRMDSPEPNPEPNPTFFFKWKTHLSKKHSAVCSPPSSEQDDLSPDRTALLWVLPTNNQKFAESRAESMILSRGGVAVGEPHITWSDSSYSHPPAVGKRGLGGKTGQHHPNCVPLLSITNGRRSYGAGYIELMDETTQEWIMEFTGMEPSPKSHLLQRTVSGLQNKLLGKRKGIFLWICHRLSSKTSLF